MRIVTFITSAYGDYGGISQYSRDLLQALSQNPSVTCVDVLPRIARLADPMPAISEKINFRKNALNNKLKYLIEFCKMLFTRKSVDLVICGHIHLLPFAKLCAFIHKAPCVLFIYGIDVWQPINNSLTKYLLKNVRHVVSISDFTYQKFSSWAGKFDYSIFPNAIDIDHYTKSVDVALLKEKYNLCDKKILLTVARLDASERYKGIDEVLNILPDVLKQYPDLIYIVAGVGNDRQRLLNKATALNLVDHVIFTGYLTDVEKIGLYQLAGIFVMPGFGEGFGFVYLEALACGLPVIASKLDGSREALRDGQLGILVNPHDPNEITTALLQLLCKETVKSIPEGLYYFSYPCFYQRLTKLVDHLGKNHE